ncbi:MAG TPA: glycosyltransferase family 4 protein [Candidatus Dormibacteraeota bacterium]|nr:glycosyltransferase family 4 protein [Candidatus Dormibacteraeota bacterium]
MKIAVLCGRYPYSGAGVIARESAEELARRHEVTFIHGGESESDRREGALRVISLTMPPAEGQGASHLYWSPALVRRLRRTLDSLNPDLIHFHIIQGRSFSLASLLLSRRRRAFWTIHDQWPLCVRSVPEPPSCEGMKRFCLFCTAWPGLSVANKVLKEAVFAASRLEVVVPSRWLGDLLRYSFLGRKRVHVVYNGIDLDLFRPAGMEGRAPAGRPPTLLYVAGPNNSTKGIAELLPAFLRLRERYPGLRLRVVGDPPEGIAGEAGVEITGRVPRQEMPDEYRRADLFVLPTLSDNTPVTLMEAMASGLPAVATAVGGIPELVVPGVTGRLVPPGDVPALTAALEGLLFDTDVRRRMGAAGRSVAETRFARQRMVSELEEIYGVARGQTQGTAPLPTLPAAVCGGQR